MTIEQRLAAAEARIAAYDAFFRFGMSDDGLVPYVMTEGRFGVMTEYWSKKPVGQGAALSVGTATDRFAGYFEIDEESCPDNASIAVFASCVPAPVHGQDHIALSGAAGNGRENYGLVLTMGERVIRWRTEGIELLGAYSQFLMGRIGGFLKTLWP